MEVTSTGKKSEKSLKEKGAICFARETKNSRGHSNVMKPIRMLFLLE